MRETFETGEENGWQDLNRHIHTHANTTAGGDEVQLLQSGQTGAMLFLGVNQRDTVKLSVNANYETAPTNNTFLGTAYDALFSQFTTTFGGAIEGGVTATASEFDEALFGLSGAGKGSTSDAPRAYLNYLYFDKEMNYVRAGFEQVSTAAEGVGTHETISLPEIIADREGYILAYLSNENQEAVNVHFDDFTVYHGKTNIVQAQSFYPFGMSFGNYQRTASTQNRFLFNQGTGDTKFATERIFELGVDMTKRRTYDYAIGRFWQVDPLADVAPQESWSSYHYSFNNPILYNDPFGEMGSNPFAGIGEGIASAFTSKLNEINQAVENTLETIGKAINDGLKGADKSVKGDEPDTRGEGDQSNFSGDELVKTEGSSGSQGIKGKPKTQNDITILTEAKGVGPAPGVPGGTADLVKSAAAEVSNAINAVNATSKAKNDSPSRKTVSSNNTKIVVPGGGRMINDSTRVDDVYEVSPNGITRLIRRDTVEDKRFKKILNK